MSELQNKIVKLLQGRQGPEALADSKRRRQNYIMQSLAVYYAIGGTDDELEALKRSANQASPAVSDAVGNLLFELAALGHLADFDIIQAAYNLIDADDTRTQSR